jgi:hypothetical protein
VALRRRTRRVLVGIGIVAVLLVGIRLALDPIVTWRTQRVLDGLEGMRGSFDDVAVSLHELSYEIRGLRIVKVDEEGRSLPFVAADRARFGLYFKELLRGNVVADVDLEAPALSLVSAKAQPKKREVAETKEVGRGLEDLAPFRIDRLQVKDGLLVWIDATSPDEPRLRLHQIEGTLENFASRKALAANEPTVLAARGVLQGTGKVSVFATADPLAKKLTFAGQATLEGLRVAELSSVVAAKSDVTPNEGVLDLSVRFKAEDGHLSGGVRPFLKEGGTRAAEDGIGPKLKSLLADAALEIFESDRAGGKDVVATTIPIRGTVEDPRAQAVPTILGILRNAFVRGLSDSLSGLPPPEAKEREGVLEQARRALSPNRGAQPRAQPPAGER